MRGKRFGIIGIIVLCILFCFSTVMASEPDRTESVLSKLQGTWYDIDGNAILNFSGTTINDCPVVGVYKFAGGGSNFGCILRIVESGGYRDLRIGYEGVGGTSNYHAHLILVDNVDSTKDRSLLRTPTPRYYETVGGIGLDMTTKEVISKYGNPDINIPRRQYPKEELWRYSSIGLELVIRRGRVAHIRVLNGGDRRFDRTGFNCDNTPYEFQKVYGFKMTPKAGGDGAFGIGYGEYLWFNGYPKYVELSPYWN